MKSISKYLFKFLKINLFTSLFVWLLIRFNLYFDLHINNDKNILILNGVIYIYLLLIPLYIYRKKYIYRNLDFIIATIFTISYLLLLNYLVPSCDGKVYFKTTYVVISTILIILCILITTFISFKYKNNFKLLIFPFLISIIHFLAITFTFYFNYLILYEKIFA